VLGQQQEGLIDGDRESETGNESESERLLLSGDPGSAS
jgi:hypothetical protein